ncbi:MAG: hypothetical protein Edafosvirus5_6 [Edafosvirus sp.]|uniref:Uncharacterized protein n=1 Tax=Edafosvirus sp. TaxID=2487765 RepID=A0A3G4ZT78_9VIRU|nr:MAG: hypothetical protein Edafosvirus5_6 [Edafosvirus sp.]
MARRPLAPTAISIESKKGVSTPYAHRDDAKRSLAPLAKGKKGGESYVHDPVDHANTKRTIARIRATVIKADQQRYRGTLPTELFRTLHLTLCVMKFLGSKEYFCWMGIWRHSTYTLTHPTSQPLWLRECVVFRIKSKDKPLLGLFDELRTEGRKLSPSFIKAQAIKKKIDTDQKKREAKKCGRRWVSDEDRAYADDDDVHIDGWGDVY